MTDEIQAKATSRQMSLALFEDMLAEGLPISDAKQEIGYQRNNVFIDVSDVGITARRLIDAAHFIVAQETTTPKYYDVELSFFRWLMRYDSYNYKHLRKVISEAQKALVQVSDTPPDRAPTEDDQWVSVQLLGIVAIRRGRISFEVPEPLLRHIKDPDKSHWLSLRITSAFTLSYARAIYDHVLPFVVEGTTGWIALDEVRAWPGKSGSGGGAFKYFKRDSLEPAVRQINELSDIDISYETRTESPKSKKIDRIRFRLARKTQAHAIRANLQDAKDIYLTLKNEFGLTERQFGIISQNRASWTDDRIYSAIEYTRTRLLQGKITQSPSGYLMKALREGWNISPAEKTMTKVLEEKSAIVSDEVKKVAKAQQAVQHSNAVRETEAKNRLAEEVATGRQVFDLADEKARKELLRAYFASAAGKLTVKRLKLEPASLSESDVLAHPDLAWAFCQFVYLRNKPKTNAAGARRTRAA
ncbi:initiator replication protein B (plasmid) [Pandoraea faecigallinarum]|uniref:Initiator replication protein B n=1 Tax=Pandoraea faecigallinarum TaxID=656179 RepID=A0A0H3X3I7_9BURK|nr:replication initiation protein [Pandoraea faecigallinarum]AKM33336.1 initiator replication protein B [Pandoraea faecigallinarum]